MPPCQTSAALGAWVPTRLPLLSTLWVPPNGRQRSAVGAKGHGVSEAAQGPSRWCPRGRGTQGGAGVLLPGPRPHIHPWEGGPSGGSHWTHPGGQAPTALLTGPSSFLGLPGHRAAAGPEGPVSRRAPGRAPPKAPAPRSCGLGVLRPPLLTLLTLGSRQTSPLTSEFTSIVTHCVGPGSNAVSFYISLGRFL